MRRSGSPIIAIAGRIAGVSLDLARLPGRLPTEMPDAARALSAAAESAARVVCPAGRTICPAGRATCPAGQVAQLAR
jgi:hypothetical protein